MTAILERPQGISPADGDDSTPEVAARLRAMVSGVGGLVSGSHRLPTAPGDPRFAVYAAPLGDLAQALPYTAGSVRRSAAGTGLDGAGSGLRDADAAWLCVAEALERYSSCSWHPGQFRWATANELGAQALPLDRVPRISPAEAEHPSCLLVPPDPDAPMRWVRGLSLDDGQARWIPAPLVYLHLPFASRGERFTAPISTGCAAHTDLSAALSSALCEVVERDAIALTWLQQLSWPQLDLDPLPVELREYLDRAESCGVRTHLLDATTDVGIPTVYCLQIDPGHPRIRSFVMCATDSDPVAAAAKVLRESASGRIALKNRQPDKDDPNSFLSVHDGALYMAAPQRAQAFDFLTASADRRALAQLPRPQFTDSRQRLRWLLDRVRAAGMTAYAVDLSSDEAIRAGVWVVRVIVPELMPLSFMRRARYQGHPRLYQAPAALGMPVLPESDLNPWPQPFA